MLRPDASSSQLGLEPKLIGAPRSDVSHFDPRGRRSELEGYADDILDVCAGPKAEGITFAGHSVGPSIGLVAARRILIDNRARVTARVDRADPHMRRPDPISGAARKIFQV